MQVKDFKTYLHHFDEFLLIFIDTITWRSRVLWSSTKLTTPKWSILGKREKYGGICGGIEDPYKRNVIDQCSQGDTNTRVLWIHGLSMARCMMIFRSKKIYTCNSKGRIKKNMWNPPMITLAWDQCHWKGYLLSFLCIWRTSKIKPVCDLGVQYSACCS